MKCKYCGNKIALKETERIRKYCNPDCRRAYWANQNKGSYKKRTYPDKPCDICGTMFTPKSTQSRYCANPKCREIAKEKFKQAKRTTGKPITDIPQWMLVRGKVSNNTRVDSIGGEA